VNGCGEFCARPSAYTKAGIQWLDRATIAEHVGRASAYALARDQARPADPARGSREDRGECTRSDGGGSSDGRSIRHRHSQRRRDRLSVQTPDPLGHRVNHLRPLILKTSQALSVGQEFVSDNAIGINVTDTIPGDRNAPFETGQLLSYAVPRNRTGWTRILQATVS